MVAAKHVVRLMARWPSAVSEWCAHACAAAAAVQVPLEDALRFADGNDLAFMETSAKTDVGVTMAFSSVVQGVGRERARASMCACGCVFTWVVVASLRASAVLLRVAAGLRWRGRGGGGAGGVGMPPAP